MPMESVEWDPPDSESEVFIEVDPTGRYGRYDELLGVGAVKKVYRAFDQEEGIEVAWNQVKLKQFSGDEVMIERLYGEVRLLRSLKNKNIIALYSVWEDELQNTLNFITECCTSGNLREYRKKHKHVSLRALKKWAKQILKGLEYLHNHQPCIIHRDLNASNIFVNGNIGQVIIQLIFAFFILYPSTSSIYLRVIFLSFRKKKKKTIFRKQKFNSRQPNDFFLFLDHDG